MRFIGFDCEGMGTNTQFDCVDSEIATARIGFIALGQEPDVIDLPQPSLEGKAISRKTAERIVGGNVALLQILGNVGLSEQCSTLHLAVRSGIKALVQAAEANR